MFFGALLDKISPFLEKNVFGGPQGQNGHIYAHFARNPLGTLMKKKN